MKDECVSAIVNAAGRAMSKADLKKIEDNIGYHLRQLAKQDREAFMKMSPDARLREAARLAGEQAAADAAKDKQRVALTIMKHDVIDRYVKSQKDKYGMDSLESLDRVLAPKNDGKDNFQSVNTLGRAIAHDNIRQMVSTFEAIGPKFLGMLDNKEGMSAIVYEMRGEDSKAITDPETAAVAKRGAADWKKITDNMREQMNSAGGKIGQRDDWGMPQHHSQYLVSRAAKILGIKPKNGKNYTSEDHQEAWVNFRMVNEDRDAYVNEDGSLMTEAQVHDALSEAWLSISTAGDNKIQPGKFTGNGMAANRHSQERSLHSKDAKSYLEYHEKFGGLDPYTIMMRHIVSLADDISLVERLGPNPDATFQYWLAKSVKETSTGNPINAAKVKVRAATTQILYNYLAGHRAGVVNRFFAQANDIWRNAITQGLLGSSYISSIPDNATMRLTAEYNRMSHVQLTKNQLRTMNFRDKDELRLARNAGMSLQTLIGQINRWGDESLIAGYSAKLSSLTIRLSVLNQVTEARRRAFGTTLSGAVGSVTRKYDSLESAHPQDKQWLESKGVNANDFAVWKAAELEDWGYGNDNMLTPASIYNVPDEKLAHWGNPKILRNEAALKLLGFIDEETNMAVIEPGARDAAVKSILPRGTSYGELARAVLLFKSFPISLVSRHLTRALGEPLTSFAGISLEGAHPRVGKAVYISALIASTWLMGALAVQINDIASGKDPQDMTSGKFWLRALLKGGSLGIYGDFLFADRTRNSNSALATLAGPQAADVEDIIRLGQMAFLNNVDGDNANVGAQALKMAKKKLPLQYWYTKTALDRMIFNDLQEYVSPGYMGRIQSRVRQESGQEFWWPPGSPEPQRAPNFSAAVGQ